MGGIGDLRGNRLAVPVELDGRHFLYKTGAPAFDAGDVDLVVRTVRSTVQAKGLGCAEIQVFSAKGLDIEVEGAGSAMRRMAEMMPGKGIRSGEPSILVCEWAIVHVDHTFAGAAFLSYVLHTGEHPYVLQTLHTEEVAGIQQVTNTTLFLSEGDGFVFDPTTGHMVAPKYPATGQLLIVLQVELQDRDLEDRAALMAAVKPLDGNQDEGGQIGR